MPPKGRPLFSRRKSVQGQHVVARDGGSHAADGGLLIAAHGGGSAASAKRKARSGSAPTGVVSKAPVIAMCATWNQALTGAAHSIPSCVTS